MCVCLFVFLFVGWFGLAWLGLVWFGCLFVWFGLAWLGLAWLGLVVCLIVCKLAIIQAFVRMRVQRPNIV